MGMKSALTDNVYSRIKNEINAGKWKEGEKIPSEKYLCETYSVSRTTIRAALQRLEAQGYIRTEQGSGTYVESIKASPGITNTMKKCDLRTILEYRLVIEKGIIVGAICNAASFLAKHGFLNSVRHTGNGLEQLQLWGGDNYTNKDGYVDEQAVSDNRIVTANGTGYLEFAKELLLLLENDTPEQIDMFYRFNKRGIVEMMREMSQK